MNITEEQVERIRLEHVYQANVPKARTHAGWVGYAERLAAILQEPGPAAPEREP